MQKEATRQSSFETLSTSAYSGKRARLLPAGHCGEERGMNSGSRFHRLVTQTNVEVGPQHIQPLSKEALDAERSALLAERQELLGGVSDRHDDLVRELFHMQNFVTMVGYNPVEAKTDDSAVFNEFKAQFDLLDHTASTLGPIRQTRRRANERRQLLANPSSSSAPPAFASVPKKKGKAKITSSEEMWNIISSTKSPKKTSKLKDGNVFLTEDPDIVAGSSNGAIDATEPMTVDLTISEDGRPISTSVSITQDTVHVRQKPQRPKARATTQPWSVDPPVDTESLSTAVIERKGAKRRRRDDSPPLISSPLKGAEIFLCPPDGVMKENLYPPSQLVNINSTRRSGRLKETASLTAISKVKIRPFEKDFASSTQDTPSPHLDSISVPTSSPSKYAIKRIKLIVRRPPPQLSNPKQRPQEPKFGSSLDRFLSSYVCVDDDGENVQLSALDSEATEEAKLREQVSKLRREGRFGPKRDFTLDESEEEEEEEETEYVVLERTSKDLWDVVVGEVVARHKKRRGRTLARQITSSIASKVQSHFDAIEAKKTKAREAEERKLRAVAKATMKMVVAEWKKAVFHIREKQRQEEEEEERRLGHEHLDAILNQSGQLLETQQGDLARTELSRSRSGSVPGFEEEPEDTDEEVNDDESDGDGDGQSEAAQDMGVEEEEVGEGTSFMLLEDEFSTRSETPATAASIGGEDEEDEEEDEGLDRLLPDISDIYSVGSPAPSLGDLMDPPYTSPVRLHVTDGPPPNGTASTPSSHDMPEILIESPRLSNDTVPGSTFNEPLVGVLPKQTIKSPTTTPNKPTGYTADTIEVLHHDEPNLHQLETQKESAVEVDTAISLNVDDGREESGDEEEVQPNTLVADPEQPQSQEDQHDLEDDPIEMPEYLKPFAFAPVRWDLERRVTPPLLLRGILRPYQQSGMEWLASLHTNKLNGILADEMGLGKTIQTIALLAHLACDLGIWGPHLIVVPTSVLLNWEMEFKKFLPGFRVLSYHGTTKRRKELRQGWNDKHHFNVCITSYALASRDAHIFKRKSWYYMILDEAHMIKNFKSQRWNILLMFRSYRRLLLTGTPLQNNLTELWALLQFLMSGANFANLKEFGEWFSNPLEKAIEMGQTQDDETLQRVSKLHTVLRPYLLRRLKRDVEKELPSKFEHLTLCPLSKRQRFLYDEFMSRAQTRDALQSGVYQKIANILMQLRKVCNHPDLFEVRPIVTSFSMTRSAIADYEIKELLVRKQLLAEDDDTVSLSVVGLRFIDQQATSLLAAVETRLLDATARLPFFSESAGEPPPRDTRSIAGFRQYSAYQARAKTIARWAHIAYINKLRCSHIPIYSEECLAVVTKMTTSILPLSHLDKRLNYLDGLNLVNKAVKSFSTRAKEMAGVVNAFAFVTPPAVALDMPRIVLGGAGEIIRSQPLDFDRVLHSAAVKLQIAFPEPSLLQYDCGKLQRLSTLLRERKAGGHRVLIFTQMTRILDILETFLNFHGYLYLRLDGATKIEDRQYITERFNADPRVFCFISSSRSGGVGINLTGADTVVFYDSDFNPQMDRQCEDRAHRIGQIRDVHIYRFVSQFTIEEAMLRKANQKRSLDDLVIQKGEFDWRSLFSDESTSALTKALGDYEDTEDRIAAAAAVREETSLVGADEDDFGDVDPGGPVVPDHPGMDGVAAPVDEMADDEQEEGGTVVEYMVSFVERDWDFFGEWRL